VGEVVRAAESDFAVVACLPDAEGKHRDCAIRTQCRLKSVFESARDAFFAELDRHTIRDIAQPNAPLLALLGFVPVPVPLLVSAPIASALPIEPEA
jgi:Rrf2 family nitric oxide-sensitive transcriptional repressor